MALMPSLADLSWPLRTERLLIRPITTDDIEALWRIRSIPSVSEWLPYVAVDQAAFTERFSDPERLRKTLVLERDGTVIGDLMVAVESPWSQEEVKEQAADTQAELGWSIDPAVEGHGYATEAARALLRLCFEDLGLRRVTALCFADNTGSWRLMERIGMRRELHTVADSLHRTRGWLDGLGYALLAEEWRAAGAASPQAGAVTPRPPA